MLLLVDLQRAFLDPSSRSCPPGAAAALSRILLLRTQCRTLGIPVAWTRHLHSEHPPLGGMGSWWSSFLGPHDRAAEIPSELLDVPGEPVFEKDRYSAFCNEHFAGWLSSTRARTLILAGFLTHICVDSTARDAFQRGYDVVVIPDACASPCWRGIDLHAASLACLGHAVASLIPSGELMEALSTGGAS